MLKTRNYYTDTSIIYRGAQSQWGSILGSIFNFGFYFRTN